MRARTGRLEPSTERLFSSSSSSVLGSGMAGLGLAASALLILGGGALPPSAHAVGGPVQELSRGNPIVSVGPLETLPDSGEGQGGHGPVR